MAGHALVFHSFDEVAEAVGGGVEIGVVDLVDVAGEDDLGAFAGPGDNGFDFVGGEVLDFIDDHELVGDGAAADVGEGLHDEFAFEEEFVDALFAGFAVGIVEVAAAGGEEVAEVVEDGLHPHGEFFVFVAGEVADVAAEGDDGPRGEEFVVALVFIDPLHAGGEGEEGFAGAGGADEGDEFDFIIEQEIEGHGLFEVAGHDAEDGTAGAGNGDQVVGVIEDTGEAGVRFIFEGAEDEVLVGEGGNGGSDPRIFLIRWFMVINFIGCLFGGSEEIGMDFGQFQLAFLVE